LGQIFVGSTEEYTEHPNTLKKYDREVQMERVIYTVKKIANSDSINMSNKVCFIYGMGSQPRSVYSELNKLKGIDVIWYDTILPKVFKPLSYIVASYTGLIKVIDKTILPEIFTKLIEMAMAGIYIFDGNYQKEFVNQISQNKRSSTSDQIVKKDPSFFIYQVDADNYESSTGIFEIITYGKNCPEELIKIVDYSDL